MKSTLSVLATLVLALLVTPQASANTSINISGNGEGSHTSVNVKNSTGGNYTNGSSGTVTNGSSQTTVTINGKTVLDEKTDGSKESSVSVTKEGDKEAVVEYNNVKSTVTTAPHNDKEEKAKVEALKKEQEKKQAEVEKKIAEAQAEAEKALKDQEATIMGRIEALFKKIRSIFGGE